MLEECDPRSVYCEFSVCCCLVLQALLRGAKGPRTVSSRPSLFAHAPLIL